MEMYSGPYEAFRTKYFGKVFALSILAKSSILNV